MKASEFDETFDDDESVLELLDLGQIRQPELATRRVNVDFPLWMVQALDREAKRLGVSRQSIIKLWLPERLESSQAQIRPVH
ncbi:MAG: CopG family transcriptional regulator [Caldilineaceae bacterium]|nr:CopG family transcriptional regulator [Caldilineaceae bacterium]